MSGSPRFLEKLGSEEALVDRIESSHPLSSDVEFGPFLGSGSFGRVFRGEFRIF
jgi:hypothetical protein